MTALLVISFCYWARSLEFYNLFVLPAIFNYLFQLYTWKRQHCALPQICETVFKTEQLQDIYSFHILKFMYLFKEGYLPHMINKMFLLTNQLHSYNTRNSNWLFPVFHTQHRICHYLLPTNTTWMYLTYRYFTFGPPLLLLSFQGSPSQGPYSRMPCSISSSATLEYLTYPNFIFVIHCSKKIRTYFEAFI